jgi:hypothetical protein
MDTDELQTILEDKLAAKDVILMELLVEEADEAPIYGEGFVSSSRVSHASPLLSSNCFSILTIDNVPEPL